MRCVLRNFGRLTWRIFRSLFHVFHRAPPMPATSLALALLGMIVLGGCKDLTGSQQLPAGTPNPSFYSTPSGALGMRNAAVLEFQEALLQYVVDAGLLTDELEDMHTGASPGILLQNGGGGQ